MEITGILSHAFLAKNLVKVKVLLNKLLKSWFDEIFFGEREFLVFHTSCEVKLLLDFTNFYVKPTSEKVID